MLQHIQPRQDRAARKSRNLHVGLATCETEILEALDPLLGRYAAERLPGERFGDFLHRAGIIALPPYPTHVQVEAAQAEAEPAAATA